MQKLRKSGSESKSEVATTTKKIELKEVKVELPADTVVMEKISKTGKSSLQSQEVDKDTQEYKKKMSQTAGCINKNDVEWYQENINYTFNQLKEDLLQDNQLDVLVEKLMLEICKSMQRIKLQPEIGLAEVQDIVGMIADKEGTVLKSMLWGELVLSKEVWQKLIKLKFEVSVDQGEQITKQLKKGIYVWNAKKRPEEESNLQNKIAYIFKHKTKAHEHNAKAAEGLAELAQKMDSLNNFYVVAQAATADGIVINSPSIDRMLMNQKINKD